MSWSKWGLLSGGQREPRRRFVFTLRARSFEARRTGPSGAGHRTCGTDLRRATMPGTPPRRPLPLLARAASVAVWAFASWACQPLRPRVAVSAVRADVKPPVPGRRSAQRSRNQSSRLHACYPTSPRGSRNPNPQGDPRSSRRFVSLTRAPCPRRCLFGAQSSPRPARPHRPYSLVT